MAGFANDKLENAFHSRMEDLKRAGKAAADYAQTHVLGINRPEDEAIRMRGWLSATVVADYRHAGQKPPGFQDFLKELITKYRRMSRGSVVTSATDYWDATHICMHGADVEGGPINGPFRRVYFDANMRLTPDGGKAPDPRAGGNTRFRFWCKCTLSPKILTEPYGFSNIMVRDRLTGVATQVHTPFVVLLPVHIYP